MHRAGNLTIQMDSPSPRLCRTSEIACLVSEASRLLSQHAMYLGSSFVSQRALPWFANPAAAAVTLFSA